MRIGEIVLRAGGVITVLTLSVSVPGEAKGEEQQPAVGPVPFWEQTVRDGSSANGLKNILGSPLLHGPMLGAVTDRSARFWVRTAGSHGIQVLVSESADLASPLKSPEGKTEMRFTSAQAAALIEKGSPILYPHAGHPGVHALRMDPQNLKCLDIDFTGIVEVTGLKSGTEYSYDILVDGKPCLKPHCPRFRTYPPAGSPVRFRVAFGGGARPTPEHERMWDTIKSHNPAAFLFLGDNVYHDSPESPERQYRPYFTRYCRPEFRRLSASTPIYAIWDDHDFGKDNCSGGPEPYHPGWKPVALGVFRQMWNNPSYGGGDEAPGCWHHFTIADVDFFMTDGRYYRTTFPEEKNSMLGPVQKKWLLDGLKASKARFKVLVSGTIWTFKNTKGDGWNKCRNERDEIFAFIEKEKICGVILLSADKHSSEAHRIDRPNGYPLYEFESSKLTNDHSHAADPSALFSCVDRCTFGLLTFDTEEPVPSVTYEVVDIDDKVLYTLKVLLNEISFDR